MSHGSSEHFLDLPCLQCMAAASEIKLSERVFLVDMTACCRRLSPRVQKVWRELFKNICSGY